ncbi:U7 snRNA-associated Sm-like protein LSm11 [Pristis pectinata]|uniref:U7 snRNA-associated Sm-like protein LSm11 n=1 Tax=Pristis pectinata TaxID=685728 RepID=UPI00223E1221|nr:U7 snRNA-associated Sm-like protein LSm11 [Pristis pectinata]
MAEARSGQESAAEGGRRPGSGSQPDPEQWAVAAVVGGETESEPEEDTGGGPLDVSSPRFDPYLALYSPRPPPLPFPAVRTFNNVAEYESFLRRRPGPRTPAPARARGRRAARAAPDPDRIERLKKLMVAQPGGEERPRPRRRDRAPKNVMTRMALHEGSPLGELYRCVQDRIKISVHIRTFKGLRGVCSGFLVAFDKFWNMALVDVDETFRKPILGKAFYNEPVLTVGRLFDQLRLQESKGEEPISKTAEQTGSLPKKFVDREAGLDNSKILSCGVKAEPLQETSDTVNRSRQSETGDIDQSKRSSKQMGLGTGSPAREKQKRKPKARPKVDYQQVSQRHLKQLFIRGENILLVSIRQ